MVRVIDKPSRAEPNFDRANPTPVNSAARYQIFNIDNGKRINLMDMSMSSNRHWESKHTIKCSPCSPAMWRQPTPTCNETVQKTLARSRHMREPQPPTPNPLNPPCQGDLSLNSPLIRGAKNDERWVFCTVSTLGSTFRLQTNNRYCERFR